MEAYNFDDFIKTFVDAGDFTNLKYQQLGSGLWGLTGVYGEMPASVPEPSTWLLLLFGAAGLLYWRKK